MKQIRIDDVVHDQVVALKRGNDTLTDVIARLIKEHWAAVEKEGKKLE